MKITLLNNYYMPLEEGGKDLIHLATSQTGLCENLAKKGHRVRVVTRRVKGTKNFIERNNVKIFRTFFINLPFLRLVSWSISSSLKLFFLELKEKDNIIICWDWSTVYPALLVKKFFGTPIICSIRGKSEAYKSWVHKIFEKFALYNCNEIIFSSKWCKSTFNYKLKKGVILHHGINTKKFNPKVKAILKFHKPTIGFFGRLSKEKRVDTLIRAVKKMKNLSDFRVLIVGSGPEKENLIHLAKNLENIEFIDSVPYSEVPKYMASCDIIVLPSQSEGFSSIILEAMAMKKVIVATRVGGAPEIIKNWENGVLFKCGDIKELSRILMKLISNKGLREKLATNGYILVKNKYNWNVIIKKWENIISSVIKNERV
jgi:glycosyltransferase involved in cell wall biosynthesis